MNRLLELLAHTKILFFSKEAESAEESESETGAPIRDHSEMKGRGRQTSTTSEAEEQRRTDDSERELAAQKFLEFLEEQDKEDSLERAKFRGEDSAQPSELFIVKEEMQIPLERQLLSGIKYNKNPLF